MKETASTEPKRGGKATMQDVANAVGVSKMAVSYVLNGKKKVSHETQEAVLEAVRRLGFEPNPHAQRLANGGCSNTVGLIAFWLDYGVASQKIHHVQNMLNEQGFNVPLYGLGLRNRHDEAMQAAAVASARQQHPRALICNTSGLYKKAIDELRRYQDRGGVVICYDFPSELDCDHVLFDREQNTYQATHHLLSLGHRDIGIGVHGFADRIKERLQGYHRALQEFGVEPREDWVFEGQDFDDYAQGGANIAAQFINMKQRPSALCIVNDSSALSFMVAVQRAGWRCPEDISIVGHDNHSLSRYYPVALTTASHPAEAIAHNVTRLLASRLNGEYQGTPRQVTVPDELIVRDSTAPI